jgi:hypothetical protein
VKTGREESMMQIEYLISQLKMHAETIHTLVSGISDEQAVWKPTSEQWSILEVVNHLFDEEVEDFRTHLDFILFHSDQPWPHIDPQGWVTQRHYNQRKIGPSLLAFLQAREDSLEWLAGLDAPNWDAVYHLPFGPITSGDMAAAWIGHDLLHIRQLVELHWAAAARDSTPYRLDYAGSWETKDD